MKRRPPKTTLTDTLFPYTTLVRSTLDKDFTIRVRSGTLGRGNEARSSGNHVCAENARRRQRASIGNAASQNDRPIKEIADFRHKVTGDQPRLEEGRAGTEGGSTCSTRLSPHH